MYWLMAMEYISHRFPNIYISPLLNPLTKMPIFTRYWLWAARRLPLVEQELIILTSPLFFVRCSLLILLCANHLCIVLVNVFYLPWVCRFLLICGFWSSLCTFWLYLSTIKKETLIWKQICTSHMLYGYIYIYIYIYIYAPLCINNTWCCYQYKSRLDKIILVDF